MGLVANSVGVSPSRLVWGRLADLAAKVRGVATETGDPRTQWSGEANITVDDGTVRHHRIDHLRGTPGNPIDETDIVEKCRRNSDGVLPRAGIEQAIDALLALEKCNDITVLPEAL